MLYFTSGVIQESGWTVPSPFSISMWCILRTLNASINRLAGTADDFEVKYIISTNKYQGDIFNVSGIPMPNSPAGTGVRVHIAITGTIGVSVKSYINGVLDATHATVSTTPASPATFQLGGRPGSADYLNGELEDVRIYNRELSAMEIMTIKSGNGLDNIIQGMINRWIVTTLGGNVSIGSDLQYDLGSNRQNMTKIGGTVVYAGGYINPRRRV